MKSAALAWLVAILCWALPTSAAEPPGSGDDALFTQQVVPILQKHCTECHGEEEPESKLQLTSRESLLYGSASGYIVVPGSAGTSLLARLVAKGSEPHMPPKTQLAEAEIDALKKWIDQLPANSLPARAGKGNADHWAYRPVKKPVLPAVKNEGWVRTPVDRFILAQLEAAGLGPSPPAEPALLLRRVYLDLVGLPPSPEETQAFLDDPLLDAFERVVDRLLASPAYGERWGRHWLDLARYADSGGFHSDVDRPHAWRYRDYVIRSFNADKPYAEFVAEQLAGDEMAPQDAEAWTATGFCRNGPSNDDNMGPQKEKYRLDQLDDVISTASAVLLGQTIGCARCHDHKYDPISQADYYRFLAIFDNAIKVDVPLDENGAIKAVEPANDKKKHPRALMALTDSGAKPRVTRVLWRGDVNNPGPEVEPGVPPAFAAKSIEFATAEDEGKTTGRRRALAEWLVSADNPLTWRVAANRIWQHHFGQGLVATPSNFGRTGSPASHPELLDWLASEMVAHGGRWKPLHRLIVTSAAYRQSSRWNERSAAVDPQNRLLWRMDLNRLEAETIRDAILAVAGTLNSQMAGPGIKPRIPAELLVASQRNKWPIVDREGPPHWRRSVYIYVKRQLPLPMLELFDSPSTSHTCERREESVVPTQALVLMNDQFTQDQAGHFADRIIREAGSDPQDQGARALRLALCRKPDPARVAEAAAFLHQRQAAYQDEGRQAADAARQALIDLCHVLINCNEFLYID